MQRSAAIEQLAHDFFDAVGRADAGFVEKGFSDDPSALVIGTDPEERWSGKAAVVAAFKAQFEALGGGYTVRSADLQAFETGDAGWFWDRPTWVLPDGTEMTGRFTAVLQREGGEWRVVHIHASLGVPNEEALGRELPT